MTKQLTHIVQNRSSRGGVVPDTILIHTTQGHNRPGVSDLTGLANFFDVRANEASAHMGVDQEGNRIKMVDDSEKAWTAGDWNRRSLNIELVGFAEWGNPFWRKKYRPGLRTAAQIVAAWAVRYDIPLRKRAPDGVAGHVDVSGPGGHWDPGKGFPWRTFILWCKLERLRMRRRADEKLERRWRTILMEMLRR